MYSTRRELQDVEYRFVMHSFIRHQKAVSRRLMGMLVEEESTIMTPKSKTKRQRKQGINERHPIDLFEKGRQNENMSIYSHTIVQKEEKTGWFKRASSISSIRSSIASRKSSARSCYSASTVKTTSSTIKKNSGNFDGWNVRKKSERKFSLPSNPNKANITNHEKIIAAFYQNMKKLDDDDDSSISSSEDENENEDKHKKKIDLGIQKSPSNHKRTEEYVLKHAIVNNYNENEQNFIFPGDRKQEELDEDEGFHPETPKTKDERKTYDRNSNKRSNSSKNYKKRISKTLSTFTDHKEIDSKRLNELLFDFNSNPMPNKFDTIPKNNKLNRTRSLPPKSRVSNKKKMIEEEPLNNKDKKHGLSRIKDDTDISISTDSAHGSTRSISTLSSDPFPSSVRLSSPRPSVPLNFIPGLTTPQQGRPRNRSLPVSLTIFRKASFCFKGVSCRIYQNSPRTYRALAHAGCIGLIIPAPESHKCKH